MGYLDNYASLEEDSRPRFRRIVYGGLGALVVIFLGLASDHESVRPARTDDSINAWVFSEKFVSRKLDSPNRAEFCAYNPASVWQVGTDSWKVACWVDERDETGDSHRSDFTALLHKHGDLWSLERLTLTR